MRTLVGPAQPVRRYVCVYLRATESSVTQELLDASQVGSPVQEVRRGAVPKGMR